MPVPLKRTAYEFPNSPIIFRDKNSGQVLSPPVVEPGTLAEKSCGIVKMAGEPGDLIPAG
jgi:hypothetical protein